MASYLEKVKEVLNQFDMVTVIQVPRAKNANAYTLACLAMGLEECLLKTVSIEVLESTSIDKSEQVGSILAQPCWMDPTPSFPSSVMELSWKTSSKHDVYDTGLLVTLLTKASCIRKAYQHQVFYA